MLFIVSIVEFMGIYLGVNGIVNDQYWVSPHSTMKMKIW